MHFMYCLLLILKLLEFAKKRKRFFYIINQYFISEIPRIKVQQWCIDNEFELIELEPVAVDDDDDGE